MLATAAGADDWPQWLGPKRDGEWRETGVLDAFPKDGPTIRWKAKVAAGYSGPAVAGGRVYLTDRVLDKGAKNHNESLFPHKPPAGIPSKERILCFNEIDGALAWMHEYNCPYRISYPLGPRATPIVDSGRLYTLGAEGNLNCLDALSGKVVWSRDLKKDYKAEAPLWGFSAHPLIDGAKLICLVGGPGSAVVAFNKSDGKEIWRSLTTKDIGYCAPMIYTIAGQRQLVIWHSESVNGLDPETGKPHWSHKVPSYQGMSISTPRVDNDRIFLTAYPMTSLMLKVKPDGSSAEQLWKGDRKTGMFCVFNTPFFDDGHIYGVSSGGWLTCLQMADGKQMWRSLEAHGGKRPEGSAEIFVVRNAHRYFLTNEKGDMIIAQLSPTGYKELSRTHLLNPTSTGFGRPVLWSFPAYANRSAYLRNDAELICVSLAKSDD